MGSDTTKAHEAFAVAPADPDEAHLDDDAAADATEPAGPLAKFEHTLGLVESLADHTDPDHLHEDLAWLVSTAHDELADADPDDGYDSAVAGLTLGRHLDERGAS